MAKIFTINGKKIPKRNLPQWFCGNRIPQNRGEYMKVGQSKPQSVWNSYTLEEVLEGENDFTFDGEYLYLK